MDTLLKEVLTTGGQAGVLVVVVFLFLKYLSDTRKSDREHYGEMMKEHIYAREQTRICVEKNTEAMATNAKVTAENTGAIKELSAYVRALNGKAHS